MRDGRILVIDRNECHAVRFGKTLQDVSIRREVCSIGDDRLSTRSRSNRRGGELIEVDGSGVTGEDLAIFRTECTPGYEISGGLRLVDPMGPPEDHLFAPLLGQEGMNRFDSGFGEPTKGIPVEIHHIGVRDEESISKTVQRVRGIKRSGAFSIHLGSLGR